MSPVQCVTYVSGPDLTNVGFTVTTRTSDPDPQTGAYDKMTKSFLNLAPRNVKAGLALAQGGYTGPLQQAPPGFLSMATE